MRSQRTTKLAIGIALTVALCLANTGMMPVEFIVRESQMLRCFVQRFWEWCCTWRHTQKRHEFSSANAWFG